MDISKFLLAFFDGSKHNYTINEREYYYDEKYYSIQFESAEDFDKLLKYYEGSCPTNMKDYWDDSWSIKPFKNWVIDIGYSDRIFLIDHD